MAYDFLIAGAGLFGAVFAHAAAGRGRSCLVIDRRPHIGGNLYTEAVAGVNVHRYGAHIFHTDKKEIWDYMRQFAEFNHFINAPLANFRGEIYNLPFNMNTFNKMWGVKTPAEAREMIAQQRTAPENRAPRNLEEQALSLVGRDIYEKLIKGYTEKQWGADCRSLPAFIIRRLPLRFTYDNNYFNGRYQGIPLGGYTPLIAKMLAGSDVLLNTDYKAYAAAHPGAAARTVYTGAIDEFFDRRYGPLAYRSLRFETEILSTDDYQGNAVVNYTDRETPYTRIIEHKHFEFGRGEQTVVTREYPLPWRPGAEPYYPVNDETNALLLAKYKKLAAGRPDVIFGGRLGDYAYYDMDQIVEKALALARAALGGEGGPARRRD
ncbi:MAG: UDP-galactopyranose mutase [Gracilibacteraceae bacterium]|jgi:UDP-galactopyranose mutase|nr:UDP-galactopyranose mutase [Gracilibacteraceae bacterium]